MLKKRQVVETNNVQRKEFSYVIGDIRLEFTLRTDIDTQLLTFKQLMEYALKDIDIELKKLSGK